MVHKILRYFAYSITIFFLPIFVVVIFLLRNFVIIRFLSVPTNRIGHFAGNIEMYLSKKKIIIQKSTMILLFIKNIFQTNF